MRLSTTLTRSAIVKKMGVIPGALVLSSWDKFDVATDGRLRTLGEFQIDLVERHDRASRLSKKRTDTTLSAANRHTTALKMQACLGD
jgi:hypothetical protein